MPWRTGVEFFCWSCVDHNYLVFSLHIYIRSINLNKREMYCFFIYVNKGNFIRHVPQINVHRSFNCSKIHSNVNIVKIKIIYDHKNLFISRELKLKILHYSSMMKHNSFKHVMFQPNINISAAKRHAII